MLLLEAGLETSYLNYPYFNRFYCAERVDPNKSIPYLVGCNVVAYNYLTK